MVNKENRKKSQMKTKENREVNKMGLIVEDKSIAVPGDILATGMDHLPAEGTYRDGDKIICSQVGLVSVNGRLVKIIPLNGGYTPKKGDVVIGKIAEVGYGSWFVDVRYAYDANLGVKEATSDFIERGGDLGGYFDIGQYVVTKIINVTRYKSIDLTMKGPGLRKLVGGKIIEVSPVKIPRIVGKMGSMINMLKEKTGCQIVAGQNGRIWILGRDLKNEMAATEAIRIIERESHMPGLTDKVKVYLEEALKNE